MSLTTKINRRQLVGLAAASLLVVTGCSTFRRSSDLEKQRDKLKNLLDEIAENHGEQVRLASIARRIEIRARELVSESQEFIGSFDSLMSTRDVTEAQLRWAINSYSGRRKWLRNDLLQLQDELHQSLEPDEWAEVVEILNHSSHSLATSSFTGV